MTQDDALPDQQADPFGPENVENGGRAVIELSPADRKSIALNGLFILAVLLAIYVASSLLIPIILALLLSILLAPIVAFLELRGLPEPVGAAAVVIGLLAGFIGLVIVLAAPAQEWFERVPANFYRIEQKLNLVRKPIADLAAATEKIEQATDLRSRKPLEVTVERPGVTEQFLTGTPRVMAAVGMVILLLYFLLASGDSFLRKIVAISPAMKDKKTCGRNNAEYSNGYRILSGDVDGIERDAWRSDRTCLLCY